jgi:hypothetical protein
VQLGVVQAQRDGTSRCVELDRVNLGLERGFKSPEMRFQTRSDAPQVDSGERQTHELWSSLLWLQ